MTTTDTQPTSTISAAQKTAFGTATSTVPPASTLQPTAVPPPPIETIPDPFTDIEDNHYLSGGAIAGIVVGSVSGAILVGLAIWRKTARRRSSTPDVLLSGFEEAFAPIKASFGKKPPAGEPTSSSIERGDVVHEMSVPDQTARAFELESPPQRYTDGLHELGSDYGTAYQVSKNDCRGEHDSNLGIIDCPPGQRAWTYVQTGKEKGDKP